MVIVPSIIDSPINLECNLLKFINFKASISKFSTMVMVEMISIYIKESFIEKWRVNSVAMRYVARMDYSEYTRSVQN